MVCEEPKVRSLLVNRRGGFFEDPFFRDAWADYSHAVRRIVDRFNHGWFQNNERLRDTHYHSLYRTLRSARQNYSAHSAKFKDDGHSYKLVMDVHEWVGGELTVRTAGGTVSVRGRVDVDEPSPFSGGGAADSDAGHSSLSTRTLHRRFTLPADADCDQVHSTLSRDAVLSVTIPKRNDVRVIPVSVEGNEESETKKSKNSLKRPSKSPPDVGASPRKKPQEGSKSPSEKDTESDEKTGKRKMRRRKNSNEKDSHGGHQSRRRSRKEHEGNSTNSKANSAETEQCSNEKRRKNSETKETKETKERKEEHEKESKQRKSRQRSSKYEDVHEITIPITLESGDSPDKVYRPTIVSEPQVYDVKIIKPDEKIDVDEETNITDASTKKKKPKNVHKIHIRREGESKKEIENDNADIHNDKENTPPSTKGEPDINTERVRHIPINVSASFDDVKNYPQVNEPKKCYYFGEDEMKNKQKKDEEEKDNTFDRLEPSLDETVQEVNIDIETNEIKPSNKKEETLTPEIIIQTSDDTSEPANARFMRGDGLTVNEPSEKRSKEREQKNREIRRGRESIWM